MIRRTCRLGLELFKTLWRLLAAMFRSRKVEVTRETTSSSQQWQSSGWDNEWEDFSVTVVPTNGQDDSQKDNGEVINNENDDGVDKVLNEMQPVLKKARKVCSRQVDA